MIRQNTQQLNIRSGFAHQRVREIAERTGMTATEIVEDALRGYVPPGLPADRVGGLVRRGRLLVVPARPGQGPITQEQVQAMIEADRDDRLDEVMMPPG